VTALSAVSILVHLLVTAVALRALAAALPDLEIDGWLPAIGAVVVMQIVAIPIGYIVSSLPLGGGPWIAYPVGAALSAITVAVAMAMMPGIKAGLGSSLIAGVCLYALRFVVSLAIGAAREAASLPSVN
jgi:hypothetical protein